MKPSRPTPPRRIGRFDATMVVMGGIVGAGIFRNPAVVAERAGSWGASLGAWLLGGLAALLGAFVYAELSALRPRAGGQYAYLSEALHPAAGFLYGWAMLTVITTAATAAVAMTFASYLNAFCGSALPEGLVAAAVLALLAAVNLVGVRTGTQVQSAAMVLKIGAIGLVVIAGLIALTRGGSAGELAPLVEPASAGVLPPFAGEPLWRRFAVAMVPVMFAYGGWQTACYVAEEVESPARTLPRALLGGVIGVIVLYLAINWVCLELLGAAALARSTAPAADVMRAAWGPVGGRILAGLVVLSTFGWIAQTVLTTPRLLLAVGRDYPRLALLRRGTEQGGVPSVAIALFALIAIGIALSGSYGQVLDYAIFADYFFFGATALALLVLRRRGARAAYRVPGGEIAIGLFAALSLAVSAAAALQAPGKAAIGAALIGAGGVLYWFLRPR